MLTFSANREYLAEAIQRASQGLAGKPPQPIYAGMLIRAGSLSGPSRAESPLPGMIDITASDGDMTFTATMDAAIEEQGTVMFPGKMLFEISRYFTGKTITIDYRDGGTAEITAGRAKFTLSADPGKKYPKWLDLPPAIGTIDAEDFATAIRRVAPAASRTHPVHRSIYLHPGLNDLYVVATDSSRMAVMVPSWEDGAGMEIPADPLVPVPVMERLAKAAADEDFIQLGWNDKIIGFSTPGLQVTSRLNSGTFPKNWKKILDSAPENWVTFDAGELTRVVKMALLAADEGRVDLIFEGSDLHVIASQQGREFSDYVDTDFSGEPVTLLLGGQVLLDGLSGCRGEAKITFTTPDKPVFLRSGDYSYMCQPRHDMKEEANG